MTFLPITSLYAVPLALIFLALFMNITLRRSRLNVSVGDGQHIDLLVQIRKHGNFIEWVPMVLILMGLAEAGGAGAVWLHTAGLLLLVGRIVHPFGLKADHASHPLRIVGNMGGILATLITTVAMAQLVLARGV